MSSFRTSDGVLLDYDDIGAGEPLLLLHGWGQTRAMFRGQHPLAEQRRLIAVDFRGHGRSDKPDHGYRIARFAADVRDLLKHLQLTTVDILGWSMGASVIWSFIDLFGTGQLRSIVLVDQPAAVAAVPWMSTDAQHQSGAILPIDALVDLASSINGDDSGAVTEAFVRGMFGQQPDPALWSFISKEIRSTPPQAAATLLFDHGAQNWLDVLPRIDRPTLVLGCDGSHVPADSQRFIASQIPDAQVHIFSTADANSHFPFLENPTHFNDIVARFLTTTARHALITA